MSDLREEKLLAYLFSKMSNKDGGWSKSKHMMWRFLLQPLWMKKWSREVKLSCGMFYFTPVWIEKTEWRSKVIMWRHLHFHSSLGLFLFKQWSWINYKVIANTIMVKWCWHLSFSHTCLRIDPWVFMWQ